VERGQSRNDAAKTELYRETPTASRPCKIPMQRLDRTLPTPAENLALDEALLEWAEESAAEREFLRIWESPQPIVVVGRSSRIQNEVNEAACRADRIPILRRSSGGAAVVAGPGCLMYALVLSHKLRPELRDISHAHSSILGQLEISIHPLLSNVGTVARAGTSDLVFCGRDVSAPPRKFSGNSLRVKRTHLLYHGTLLYNFELALIEKCLRMPPRQPDYRDKRTHIEFVMNLPLTRATLERAIDSAWPTTGELTDIPASRIKKLVATRFATDAWNYEFA
jgi:lipoate-protein ligase A